MTSQNPIILDTPDNPPHQEWVAKEWIGVGKKYPILGEVPAFIESLLASSSSTTYMLVIHPKQEDVHNRPLEGQLTHTILRINNAYHCRGI
jgi:hypothetical protein